MPFGLARFGVAPDNTDTKRVLNRFNDILLNPNCSFLGNVKFGKDIKIDFLQKYFDAVILAYGAGFSIKLQYFWSFCKSIKFGLCHFSILIKCLLKDKSLNVEGEHLPNVLNARDFVGWYNSFPDHKSVHIGNHQNAVIIGNGNVALDCARILSADISVLEKTDISIQALQKLKNSSIKNIYIVGRNGPLESKFTNKELREMTNIKNSVIHVNDKLQKNLPKNFSVLEQRIITKKIQIFRKMAKDFSRKDNYSDLNKIIDFYFWTKPLKFVSLNDNLVRVYLDRKNKIEKIDAGIVIKCIGYKSVPVPGVSFDEQKNIVPNINGKVANSKKLYVSGWLKNGPRGAIADSLFDAEQTVTTIEWDYINSNDTANQKNSLEKLTKSLLEKNVKFIDKNGWKRVNEEEIKRGKLRGVEREKIINLSEILKIAKVN